MPTVWFQMLRSDAPYLAAVCSGRSNWKPTPRGLGNTSNGRDEAKKKKKKTPRGGGRGWGFLPVLGPWLVAFSGGRCFFVSGYVLTLSRTLASQSFV